MTVLVYLWGKFIEAELHRPETDSHAKTVLYSEKKTVKLIVGEAVTLSSMRMMKSVWSLCLKVNQVSMKQ